MQEEQEEQHEDGCCCCCCCSLAAPPPLFFLRPPTSTPVHTTYLLATPHDCVLSSSYSKVGLLLACARRGGFGGWMMMVGRLPSQPLVASCVGRVNAMHREKKDRLDAGTNKHSLRKRTAHPHAYTIGSLHTYRGHELREHFTIHHPRSTPFGEAARQQPAAGHLS